ncbi:MAG: hypothetical protein OXQ92_08465 [Boseongicola sp.]|nr:hypothetical protein [Boseongicola sp.]
MRPFSIFAVVMATPVTAHDAVLPHAHSEWAFPAGLSLLVLAALGAVIAFRVSR